MGVHLISGNRLPVTGQETSYVDYDDGYYEIGMKAAYRFLDIGDGTVLDQATGLYWIKDIIKTIPGSTGQILVARGAWSAAGDDYAVADLMHIIDGGPPVCYVCLEAHKPTVFADQLDKWVMTPFPDNASGLTVPSTFTWAEAFAAAAIVNDAGGYCCHTEWRLPNVNEALSIINWEDAAGATVHSPLVVRSDMGTYWTNTSRVAASTNAVVVMYNNDQTVAYQAKAVAAHMMLCCGGIQNG